MKLPLAVQSVITTLNQAGFEAYAVGGCVRDLLMGREPKDWDVTTSANPNEIQKLFPRNFYTNNFGTVTVLVNQSATTTPHPLPDNAGRHPLPLQSGGQAERERGTTRPITEIEVTTYRVDADYSDQRHPDSVSFTKSLKEDLARRDFTVNAMALRQAQGKQLPDSVTIDGLTIIDPFGGLKDVNDHVIRAVGKPSERFSEDALRLMRAVRFSAQLSFTIEPATLKAITEYAPAITAISHERIRDELIKLVMSERRRWRRYLPNYCPTMLFSKP